MNKWKRKEDKLSQTFFVRNLSTPMELRTSWLSPSTQRCFKQLLRTGEKNGQQLNGTPPVIIPETIAGRISAPFPFSFLKWQPFFIHGSICQATTTHLQGKLHPSFPLMNLVQKVVYLDTKNISEQIFQFPLLYVG